MTWPRVAGGRRAREAQRRAPQKRGLQAAQPRELGAAPARAQPRVHAPGPARARQPAPAPGPARVLRQAHAPQPAPAVGPAPVLRQAHDRQPARARARVRAPEGAPPRAAVRPAEPTTSQGRAPHVPHPVLAAALPGQRGTAFGATPPPGTREGLGAVRLPGQVRAAVPGEDLERGTAREQEPGYGLDLQLREPLGLVVVVLARRRARPEVLSDLARTARARPAALGGMPAKRHASRLGGRPATLLPAIVPVGGPLRRTERPLGEPQVRRRAAPVRLQGWSAHPHGPTASGSTAPAGVAVVAGHTGATTEALGPEEQA